MKEQSISRMSPLCFNVYKLCDEQERNVRYKRGTSIAAPPRLTHFEDETAEGGAPRAASEPEEQRVLAGVAFRLYEVVEELRSVHLVHLHVPAETNDKEATETDHCNRSIRKEVEKRRGGAGIQTPSPSGKGEDLGSQGVGGRRCPTGPARVQRRGRGAGRRGGGGEEEKSFPSVLGYLGTVEASKRT